MKKISVIIPTYNRATLLSLALGSMVRQEYNSDDFEIIVVDNNSTDNTKKIVADFIMNFPAISIHYIYEEKQGLVYARHAGVRKASHEFLFFTDDDGKLYSNCLREISRVFNMDERIAAVAGKIDISWDKTPPDWVIRYEPLLGKLDYGDEIRIEEGLYIHGGNFSIRKSILFEVGGFHPDQIGDWLIGDGETGLCKKLHAKGFLIGWAPGAVMEHCQFVDKNATVVDIKRRFINNGIAVPYQIYCVQKEGTFSLLVNLFKSTDKFFRHLIFYIFACCFRNNDEKLVHYFHLNYYICQFPYTFKLLNCRKFRHLTTDNGLP